MKKMYFILALLLFGSGFITIKNLNAQVHADSASYDLMLSTLLSHSVPEVSVDEAFSDTSVIYIDARQHKEYNVSHIEGAVWAGYDEFDASRLDNIDKNKKLIVYCTVGYRSEKITERLIALGYSNVSNLYGGILEWVNNGYPVVDSTEMPTMKVHTYSKSRSIWLNKGEKVYD